MGFEAHSVARHLADAHRARAPFRNLPDDIGPTSLAEAYAAQEALHELLAPRYGPAAGVKIATTTRVMQKLMGIDHPCCGVIFARRVLDSPAQLDLGSFISLKIECELAIRLARDLPPAAVAYTGETVAPAVGWVMPAFELVDDRSADYRQTSALSLIADNCWNAGVAIGAGLSYAPGLELDGLAGSLQINGRDAGQGRSEDPLAVLAWVAQMVASRGRPLRSGQLVMTGSIIATLPVCRGDRLEFEIAGLGRVEASVL